MPSETDMHKQETPQPYNQKPGERERYLAMLVDNVPDVIISNDPGFTIVSWNKAAEKAYGYSESEAIGRNLDDLVRVEFTGITRQQFFEKVEENGSWKSEISVVNRFGARFIMLSTFTKLVDDSGQFIGYVSVSKDISERKVKEADLRQSESFYRSLATNSLDGIVLADENAKIIHCGPSLSKVSGYEPEDLLGKNAFEFVHPDDLSLAAQSFFFEVNKESVLNYLMIRLRHATRSWVWCTVRAHNLLDDPVLKSVVIYFTDETKRKQMEDKLVESESRFRNMIHNLKLGIILQNEKGEILICNEAALNMLGLTEDQLLGKKSFDPQLNIIDENGSPFPADQHPVPMAIKTKQPVKDVGMGVLHPGTNERVWLLVNADLIYDEKGNIINVICSFADITEQRRLSRQLIQQEIQKQKIITQATIDGQEKERLEIGKELHDNINQHLTTTRLYLEVARDKASGEVLEMISLAHKNLADIVNEIRKLSQSLVPPTLGDIGLTESVQDLCDALKRTHSFKIEFFHRHFEEDNLQDNLKLMIFRIIQEQVSNIIRHAGAKKVDIRLQSDAEHIVLVIADNGRGFDPQKYKKGMGLTNITNRAGLFGGRMQLDTGAGKGCKITVTIPQVTVP